MTTTTAEPPMSAPKMGAARAFWEFTRPHTIIGTSLAVGVFYLIASAKAGAHDIGALLLTYAASITLNIYIVGLNQLTDVDIDKVNKPYLPVAAGAFSVGTARAIVIVSALLCLPLALLQSRILFFTILTIFALGSLYSLPPFRLKGRPFWAAAAITTARAVVGNIGVYLTFSEALSGELSLPAHVLAFVGFMFGFVIVIALMKDVPDLAGDKMHNISTFTSRVGATKVMLICRLILSAAYVGMIVAGALGLPGVNAAVLIATHAAALLFVWVMHRGVDDEDADQSYAYYMHVWKLFYFEFAAFPVACFLA